MGIPRPDFFDFLFNRGRGVRKNQVDWSVDDPEFDALLTQLQGGANATRLLTTVPADTLGIDGDTAIVRYSAIALRGYQKVAGAWVRVFTFHGGDAVLLADLAAIPDRTPATAPDATTFVRHMGISGFSPVTQDDIDQSMAAANAPADLRGGNHGNVFGARANTLPNQQFGTNLADYSGINFGANVPLYIWFGLETDTQTGLSITAVTYNGVAVPVTKQADQIIITGHPIDVWVADVTRLWSEINAFPFVLTLEKDAALPSTWNRYAVVTADAVPIEADFLSDVARVSETISVFIPNGGWTDGRGFLHFALPSVQDAPTIAGLPGGVNLIADFTVRSRSAGIDINGDAMRTLSSDAPVWQMTDRFSLFPWLVR